MSAHSIRAGSRAASYAENLPPPVNLVLMAREVCLAIKSFVAYFAVEGSTPGGYIGPVLAFVGRGDCLCCADCFLYYCAVFVRHGKCTFTMSCVVIFAANAIDVLATFFANKYAPLVTVLNMFSFVMECGK